jgi:hypothetical protein
LYICCSWLFFHLIISLKAFSASRTAFTLHLILHFHELAWHELSHTSYVRTIASKRKRVGREGGKIAHMQRSISAFGERKFQRTALGKDDRVDVLTWTIECCSYHTTLCCFVRCRIFSRHLVDCWGLLGYVQSSPQVGLHVLRFAIATSARPGHISPRVKKSSLVTMPENLH